MGKPDQAAAVFSDMIEFRRFGDRGDIYYDRGAAHLWMGDKAKAKADFTRSWRCDDGQVKAKVMLIWMAWAEKKPTRRSASFWSEVIRENYSDWYTDLLAQILKRLV